MLLNRVKSVFLDFFDLDGRVSTSLNLTQANKIITVIFKTKCY